MSDLLHRCQSTVTCSHHGILWWVGVGLTQLVQTERRIRTEFFRPSLWIYLVCLRYSLQNPNEEEFLLNHVTTAPVFPSVSPLFLLLLSLWQVFPISPPPPLTCRISRMCDNRSGVNVNSQTYIISPLHNFTEAHTHTRTHTHTHTLTDRHAATAVPLCCFAASVCCVQQQVRGVWTECKRWCCRQAGSLEHSLTLKALRGFKGTFVLTCACMYEFLRCRFHRNSNTACFLGFV